MKPTTFVCFVALLIAGAASQQPGAPPYASFGVEEQDVIDPLDLALDVDYRDEEDERSLQNFRNVCCRDCGRYSGSQRLRCFNSCRRVCFSENQCVNAGRGVYAGWCQSRCSSRFAAFSQPLTPRQCTGACASQVQTLCRRRCNDLFPGCNANESMCLSEASRNCFVG